MFKMWKCPHCWCHGFYFHIWFENLHEWQNWPFFSLVFVGQTRLPFQPISRSRSYDCSRATLTIMTLCSLMGLLQFTYICCKSMAHLSHRLGVHCSQNGTPNLISFRWLKLQTSSKTWRYMLSSCSLHQLLQEKSPISSFFLGRFFSRIS